MSLIQNRLSDFHFGTLNGVRGDLLGSILSRTLFTESQNGMEIVKVAQLREARLIANLYRSQAIMTLMNIVGTESNALDKLLSELVATHWPQSIANDLDHFLKNYTIRMKEFQNKGG